MSFGAPIWLLTLLAVPLALAAQALARRRATRYAVRLPAAATLAQAAIGDPAWRRRVPIALALASAAALAMATAKPQVREAVPIEGASIMLVCDHSASMSATDLEPDRLSAAEHAAQTFLNRLPPATRVGIVTYSDGADGSQPPTTDRDPVRQALLGQSPVGATATGDALQVALDALRGGKSGGRRPPAAIVLLSDGKTTAGRDPVGVAAEARRRRVPIYTVALGSDNATIPSPLGAFAPPIPVPPDRQTLRRISQVSGGRAFTTADAGRLDSIYRSLGSQLATRHRDHEVTAGFAAGGLLLLLAAAVLSQRWAGRLP